MNVPMVLDGYAQRRGWRVSHNGLRFMTGIASGWGLSVVVVSGSVLLGQWLMAWK
ncbi:DUF2085 domain-containing protein [Brevibacillus sp. SYP-B805]|nr:DUF2085 domain-containing protein [Brevibacillus sp. SYP-B805]